MVQDLHQIYQLPTYRVTDHSRQIKKDSGCMRIVAPLDLAAMFSPASTVRELK